MGFAHQGTVDPGQIEGDIPSSGVKKKDHDIEFDSKTMETTPLGPGYWATGATSHAAGGDSLSESSYDVLHNGSSTSGDASTWKRYDGYALATCKHGSSLCDCTSGAFDYAAAWESAGVAAGKSTPRMPCSIDFPTLATTPPPQQQYRTLSTSFSMGRQAKTCESCSIRAYELWTIVDGVKDTDVWASDALADTNVCSTSAQHDRNYLIMPSPEGQTFAPVCANLASEVSQCPACSKRALRLLGRASDLRRLPLHTGRQPYGGHAVRAPGYHRAWSDQIER